ncbi:MAG: methylated-DNA--[protein]-cysteine S-methyltransferase [Pseudomonadota bacterium]|nr:methylated-DNA--[protein]-cysteine S-methyltransferase [Pseudomonadota bacterium]
MDSTFALMQEAMALLDAAQARRDSLTLEELAGALGLSPSHFQRTFSRWVGVSPKRYLQYLQLDHAKALLKDHSVLDTTLALGLSSPSRLHDLFLRWEAMAPGAAARGGAGLSIAWGTFESPFGPVVAAGTGQGLCGLAFAAELGDQGARFDLKRRWPDATWEERPEALKSWVENAFGKLGDVPLAVAGGPFDLKVWKALIAIPEGAVATYSHIAEAIGNPKAVRAVGSAVGRNPLAWLIPCHRVLRRDGALGGYHWGLPVKRGLLAWESARRDGAAAAPPGALA